MGILQILAGLARTLSRDIRALAYIVGLICLILLVWTLQHPRLYESTERLLVVSSDVSQGFAPSTVGPLSKDQLYRVQQQVLSRESLSEIIAAYGLFSDTSDQDPEGGAEKLRDAIGYSFAEPGSDEIAGDGITIVTITVQMTDPLQAQRIAHELGHRALQYSTRMRVGQAAAILGFAQSRENAMVRAREDLVRRVSKLQETGGDPDTGNEAVANGEIAELKRKLAHSVRQLDAAADRRVQAEAAVELEQRRLGERLAVLEPATPPGRPVTGHPVFMVVGAGLSLLAAMTLALLAEALKLRRYKAGKMARDLGFVPLVSIPIFSSQPVRSGWFQDFRKWVSPRF